MNRTTGASSPEGQAATNLEERWQRRLDRACAHGAEALLAWAELLESAGWCVALRLGSGDLWLGSRGADDLARRGGKAESWTDLLTQWQHLPEARRHLEGSGVRVWAAESPVGDEAGKQVNLTPREGEVLKWLKQGKTDPEIAAILGCAVRTVEKHVGNLYRKTGARNRAEMILQGREDE